MAAQYYIRLRGKVLGPFTLEQLQGLRDQGRLSPFHELSQDRVQWVAASSVTELFAAPAPKESRGTGKSSRRSKASRGTAIAEPESVWHYVDAQGERRGPVPRADLDDLLRRGEIQRDSLVWREGMADWAPAWRCLGLGGGRASESGANLGGSGAYSSLEQWESRLQWTRVRLGLNLLLVGAFLVAGNLLLSSFGGLVAWLGHSSGGLLFTSLVGLALFFSAVIVEASGTGFCAAITPASGARGFGITVLVLTLVNVVFLLFPLFAVLYMALAGTQPFDVQMRASLALSVLNLVVSLLYYLNVAVRNVLHLLYLRAVCKYLRAQRLLQFTRITLLVYVALLVASLLTWISLLLLAVTSMAAVNAPGPPRDVLLLMVVFFLFAILAALAWLGWVVLYVILLFRLRAVIPARGGGAAPLGVSPQPWSAPVDPPVVDVDIPAVERDAVVEAPVPRSESVLEAPAPRSQSRSAYAPPPEPMEEDAAVPDTGQRTRLIAYAALCLSVALLVLVGSMVMFLYRGRSGGEVYGGIEISSTGVTAIAVRVLPDGDFDYIWPKPLSLDTSPTEGMDKQNEFDREKLRETVATIKTYYERLAIQEKIPPQRIHVAAGSGLFKALRDRKDLGNDLNAVLHKNEMELATAVQKDTGSKVDFLDDSGKEVELQIQGLIDPRHRDVSLLIDLGSSATRGGYFDRDAGRCVTFETQGSKTLGKKLTQRAGDAFQAQVLEAERLARSELGPDLQKRRAEFRERSRIYLTGGMAWVVATYLQPARRDQNLVPLSVADIDGFSSLVRTQPGLPPFTPPSGISAELRDTLEKDANRQRVKIFKEPQQLLAGAAILKTLAAEFDLGKPSKQVYFHSESRIGWLLAYLREKAQPARR